MELCMWIRGYERYYQWRIQRRSPGVRPAPLFLDQTAESRRAEKCFLRPAPPPYLGVWMTPLPPSPYVKVWICHWSLTNHVPKYMRRLTKHEGTNIAAVDLVFLWVLKLGSEGQFFSVSLRGFLWAAELRRGGGEGGKRTPTWDCTPRYGQETIVYVLHEIEISEYV